jgi:hypothetical protein
MPDCIGIRNVLQNFCTKHSIKRLGRTWNVVRRTRKINIAAACVEITRCSGSGVLEVLAVRLLTAANVDYVSTQSIRESADAKLEQRAVYVRGV